VSTICPEIIYNEQVERIRAMEYSVGSPPQAIRFQIFESLSNKVECKLIKLKCQSEQNPVEFEINTKKQPKFFETKAESEHRERLKKLGAKDLDITDFTKKYHRTVALALFVK
jgi:hypothetical protein